MKVSYKNNTLTVVTDVTKAAIDRGLASLTIKDDKENQVYEVFAPKKGDATGALSVFGIATNVFIDDKAALVLVMPVGTTQAAVEKQYGKALLAAKKYIPVIASSVAAEEAAITEVFDEVEATTETADAE